MFNVQSIALTAALFGLDSARTAHAATGCYPAYVSGNTYSVGAKVSATTTTTTEPNWVSCDPASSDCPSSGFKNTGGVETTTKNNFDCYSNDWCSSVGYGPGETAGSSAWNKGAECTGTAAVTVTIPAAWSGGGCPKSYAGGTDYEAGATVSVAEAGYSMVYKCVAEPNNQFCGMAGYEPGDSYYWEQAWTVEGSCTGTFAPTDSPSFDALADAGGCPLEFSSGDAYEPGDKVSKDGFVYECKGDPAGRHCSQSGYAPGVDVGGNEYWKEAWTITGYCSGTIAPTTSPNFVSLKDMGGCPDQWSAKSAVDAYEEGDLVASQGLVYECKAWPYSGHCGQAGYEPNMDPATPDAWKDAWTTVGYCSGSMPPTSSPSYDSASSVGPCPGEWSSGIHTKYEEGDMVSIIVSQTPLRKVAFKCKAWPYSGHCAQYSPTNELGGNLGWAVAGSCDGSIGPTQSPSFDSLGTLNGGCPAAYVKGSTDYEAGDLVSVMVSDAPRRQVAYKCKPFPNSGYCIQGAYEPTGEYGSMGWELMGACDGTTAPTDAPAVYAGTCTFIKCLEDQTCEKGDAANGVTGSTACDCVGTATDCTTGKQTVCTDTAVLPYDSATNYAYGDIFRVGTQKYKCKDWPNGLWCGNEAYAPTEGSNIWRDAWTQDGTCA